MNDKELNIYKRKLKQVQEFRKQHKNFINLSQLTTIKVEELARFGLLLQMKND